jgi:hypothetical protein
MMPQIMMSRYAPAGQAPRKCAPRGGFGALTARRDRGKKAAVINAALSPLHRRRGAITVSGRW